MRSLEENVEALSRAMMDEAEAEAAQILAEAREKADAIRQRAQEQADAESARILERARQEADRLRGQVIATTQMKARTSELEHREQLLDKVFTTARKKIPALQQTDGYNTIALNLLREALSQLSANEVVVRVDPKTRSVLTDAVLDQISQEMNLKLSIGEPLENKTGVVVATPDGHLQYDNTLETRLNRLQNTLRSPVYRLLIGESL